MEEVVVIRNKTYDEIEADNARMREAFSLIADESREDAATWMRGVARAALTQKG